MKTTNFCSPERANNNSNALVVDTVFFDFEEDFAEDNVRCIPMIVRFKLDACGIKLKLGEWSKFTVPERTMLSVMKCAEKKEIVQYANCLRQLIMHRTGSAATDLPIEQRPAWANTSELPMMLLEKLQEFNWQLSLLQWNCLSNLQRFVLLKLCRPGHENKNFPKAMKEFGLV